MSGTDHLNLHWLFFGTLSHYNETLSTAGVIMSYLIDAISHGLQRELSGSIHRLAVISWSPAGAVDVNNLGHVADG